MRKVPIPGGTATLRDPSEVKVKHRRFQQAATLRAKDIFESLPEDLKAPIPEGAAQAVKDKRNEALEQALMAMQLSGEQASAFLGIQDGVILALLESWTLDEKVPATLDEVGDMDPAVYDALAEATKEDGAKLVMKSFGATPDKSAPFGESANSNGL